MEAGKVGCKVAKGRGVVQCVEEGRSGSEEKVAGHIRVDVQRPLL